MFTIFIYDAKIQISERKQTKFTWIFFSVSANIFAIYRKDTNKRAKTYLLYLSEVDK